MPKISIIMNCFNGERYLKEAIDSVFAQTVEDWEIVFWDNGSTDKTSTIAQSYDSRLRYFRSEITVPLGAARNLALDRAGGDWIAFVDHDDVNFPNRLERQIEYLAGADYVMCSAGVRDVDPVGRKIRDVLPRCRSGYIFESQLKNFDLYLQTTMVSARALRHWGIRINELCQTSEDYNLFMRLAAKGPVAIVPEVLSTCRIVPSSLTNRTLECHARERFITLDQLRAENPGVERRYPRAFSMAEARGRYYRAKYLMEIGKHRYARREMKSIRSTSAIYVALYVVSFVPRFWHFVHKRQIRSRIWALISLSNSWLSRPMQRNK